MSVEHAVRLLAGTLVLLGMALGTWVTGWWYLLVVFVGLNLVQSSLTKWCLAETILKKMLSKPEVET